MNRPDQNVKTTARRTVAAWVFLCMMASLLLNQPLTLANAAVMSFTNTMKMENAPGTSNLMDCHSASNSSPAGNPFCASLSQEDSHHDCCVVVVSLTATGFTHEFPLTDAARRPAALPALVDPPTVRRYRPPILNS
ncbi:hypothetical protein ACKC9G_14050 [Pokkaliibacter sp. CJK22405]|uniref:hypothetical protein n=1 Tax=Pokkaliibacter sp. CJK22405 TaxID=3384615 RepID=UPI003984FD19